MMIRFSRPDQRVVPVTLGYGEGNLLCIYKYMPALDISL